MKPGYFIADNYSIANQSTGAIAIYNWHAINNVGIYEISKLELERGLVEDKYIVALFKLKPKPCN